MSAFEGGASGPDPGSCRSRAGSGGVVASEEMSPEIPAQVRGVSVCGFFFMSSMCIYVCHVHVYTHVRYIYIHIHAHISLSEKYFGDSVGRAYSSVLWISIFTVIKW